MKKNFIVFVLVFCLLFGNGFLFPMEQAKAEVLTATTLMYAAAVLVAGGVVFSTSDGAKAMATDFYNKGGQVVKDYVNNLVLTGATTFAIGSTVASALYDYINGQTASSTYQLSKIYTSGTISGAGTTKIIDIVPDTVDIAGKLTLSNLKFGYYFREFSIGVRTVSGALMYIVFKSNFNPDVVSVYYTSSPTSGGTLLGSVAGSYTKYYMSVLDIVDKSLVISLDSAVFTVASIGAFTGYLNANDTVAGYSLDEYYSVPLTGNATLTPSVSADLKTQTADGTTEKKYGVPFDPTMINWNDILGKTWENIYDTMQDISKDTGYLGTLLDGLTGISANILDAITTTITNLMQDIKTGVLSIPTYLTDIWTSVKAIPGQISDVITSLFVPTFDLTVAWQTLNNKFAGKLPNLEGLALWVADLKDYPPPVWYIGEHKLIDWAEYDSLMSKIKLWTGGIILVFTGVFMIRLYRPKQVIS